MSGLLTNQLENAGILRKLSSKTKLYTYIGVTCLLVLLVSYFEFSTVNAHERASDDSYVRLASVSPPSGSTLSYENLLKDGVMFNASVDYKNAFNVKFDVDDYDVSMELNSIKKTDESNSQFDTIYSNRRIKYGKGNANMKGLLTENHVLDGMLSLEIKLGYMRKLTAYNKLKKKLGLQYSYTGYYSAEGSIEVTYDVSR